MIRSAWSVTHFWQRRRMRARPAKPIASQAGWAARACATIAATSSASRLGTEPTTSPVAGFSTVISAVCSSVAIVVSSLGAGRGPSNLPELDALDDGRLDRAVAGAGGQGLDGVDGLHAGGHAPEGGVLAVQPGVASLVTRKNCEPLVFGPALAMASVPRTIL